MTVPPDSAPHPPVDERILGSVFEALPEATVLTDSIRRIRLVNRSFTKLFGYIQAEASGQDICRLLDSTGDSLPTDRASFITEYRTRDGRIFPAETTLVEVRSDEHLEGYLFSIRDVTDRQETIEALQTSELQYRALFEAANDALIIFEPEDEVIIEVNPRACELYGFSRREMIGRSLKTLTEDVERGRQAIDDILRRGGIRNFQSRHLRKDGAPIELQISCSLLAFSGRTAVLTILRDISEQKETERALREAKDAAEQATRMKSDFLARMSHEIRTPMNGVIGLSEVLLETSLDTVQRDYVQMIASSSETLLSLINDLLDFSKIEAGKMTLEQTRFDPSRVVGEVVELFAPRAEGKDLHLAFYIDPDVPAFVSGDPIRFRQVLSNLVSNAVKFTTEGEVVVSMSAATRPSDRIALNVSVSDTGIGVDQEQHVRLFEAFSQAQDETTRKYGGTGLGLCISKQLTEMMGGSIFLESRPGIGSTFKFDVLMDAVESPAPGDGPRLEGCRVLVIDQVERIREICAGYLRHWGADVIEAECGSVALKKIGAGDRFDIVFIGRRLPDFEALSLARAFRAICGSHAMKLVLLTRFDQRTVTPEACAAGIDSFLSTPIWPHRLRSVLAAPAQPEAAPCLPPADVPGEAAREDVPKILLVEDNLTNQRVATTMLSKLGYVVDLASNGQDAIDALNGRDYAVVLMDCQMPHMDGFEATRRIRALGGSASQIPIIALTANAMKSDRDRCLAAGMDDYLMKPFRSEHLCETVKRWVQ